MFKGINLNRDPGDEYVQGWVAVFAANFKHRWAYSQCKDCKKDCAYECRAFCEMYERQS